MRIIWLLILVTTVHVMGLPITENFTRARELSSLYKKPLVLAFVGSDWAPPFDAARFEKGISNQCILVKVDFPEFSRQTPERMEENRALKAEFKVATFPTMILLSASGEEITRFGEVGSTQILEALQTYESIVTQMAACQESTEALYVKAKNLGAHPLAERLMKQGLDEAAPYFFIEKYAQMVGEGKGLSQEAMNYKAKGLEKDPNNQHGFHLRCAMLEFQAHASLESPLEAVKPLIQYIQGVGQGSPDLWQIHLFISEYLMKHNLKDEALKYAEFSMKGAPREIRDEVTQVIDSSERLELDKKL